MPYQNFAEILSNLRKQRAAVSGRPPSKQEVAGVVAGIQSGADERLSRRADRELTERLQETQIGATAEQNAKTLAEQKRQFDISSGKQTRQFDVSTAAREREFETEGSRFATQLSQQQKQFETTAADRKREFDANLLLSTNIHNETMALKHDEFAENERQFNEASRIQAEQFEAAQGLRREELAQQAGQFKAAQGLRREELAQQAGQFKETRTTLSAVEQQQLRIADEARADDKRAQKMQGFGAVLGAAAGGSAAAAGLFGAAVGGPAGALIGAAVGSQVLGMSYLCTETAKKTGLDEYTFEALGRFRRYAILNHKRVLKYYLKIGPDLIKRINEKDKSDSVFERFKKDIIQPVVVATDSSQPETAYQLYKNRVLELIKEFLPEQAEKARLVDWVDETNFFIASL